jgi:hypothetical protein
MEIEKFLPLIFLFAFISIINIIIKKVLPILKKTAGNINKNNLKDGEALEALFKEITQTEQGETEIVPKQEQIKTTPPPVLKQIKKKSTNSIGTDSSQNTLPQKQATDNKVKQLQQAIIWSEILKPPIALRKKDDYSGQE